VSREFIGRRTIHYDVTESTNDRAAELADDPEYSGVAITAGLQSRGRGQHGRVWQARPDRGVLLSVLLHPPEVLRRPAVLTAWVAVVIAELVRDIAGTAPTIKWPNDVLVGGKKICGILIESGMLAGKPPHFVVGIGLNVMQSAGEFAEAGLPDATSLTMLTGRELTLSDVTRRLLDNLDAEYGRILREGTESLEAAWKWQFGLLDKPVTVELMSGEFLEGHLRELSFAGLIVDRGSSGLRHLQPEEIRHLR
jgi:BirA family transcriptional regulator, biotin operon repressor / biotin---[acetyl-CoA-carboxylase] ligase